MCRKLLPLYEIRHKISYIAPIILESTEAPVFSDGTADCNFDEPPHGEQLHVTRMGAVPLVLILDESLQSAVVAASGAAIGRTATSSGKPSVGKLFLCMTRVNSAILSH